MQVTPNNAKYLKKLNAEIDKAQKAIDKAIDDAVAVLNKKRDQFKAGLDSLREAAADTSSIELTTAKQKPATPSGDIDLN